MKLREQKITVRLTNAERDHLRQQADRAGMGVEMFVRNLIMGIEIKPRPPNELPELLRQIAAIGNNINQIARLANGSKYVRQEDITQVKSMMERLWEKCEDI